MRIFCSGIGGIGLSAYASLQQAAGHTVSGSDRSDSALLQDLREHGVEICLEQDGSALPEDTDVLVYSEAIAEDAPERVKAREMGIRQISYFHALGELSSGYRVIAVCGTHGKSSTTAMAARMLVDAGLDPTVVVGTKVPDLGGRNWRTGSGNLFLVEACEYRRSFLHLSPSIVLLTSLDWDHVDAYPTPALYRAAYADFLALLPDDGIVVTHGGDAACHDVAAASRRRVIDADTCEPIISLRVPGAHMRSNAQLVQALAKCLDIDEETAVASLRDFAGTWRRMEYKGDGPEGISILDDYAHHPNEVRASSAAIAERYAGRRLVCVFQPHMHDRTVQFFDAFAASFGACSRVCVTDVYEARRETTMQKADPEKLAAAIASASKTEASYTGSLEETEQALRSHILQENDVVLLMGAGSITRLGDTLRSGDVGGTA